MIKQRYDQKRWVVKLRLLRAFASRSALVTLLLMASGCYKSTGDLQPKLNYYVQDTYLAQLPSIAPALTSVEKEQDWAKEYRIGKGLGRHLELYPAMTAFKRAEILAAEEGGNRLDELRYNILLCYYLGQKYQEVIYEFENGPLRDASPKFPPFHDLLLILYDAYFRLGKGDQAHAVLETILYYYPETAKCLETFSALMQADFGELKKQEGLQEVLSAYGARKKSPGKARTFNAILPGAGYLYLGQYQSALTAALLNGLFIAGSYYYLDRQAHGFGDTAVGIILVSFELGWYFGGIFGAGLEAKAMNEHLYQELVTPAMHQQRLFPVLNLRYGF